MSFCSSFQESLPDLVQLSLKPIDKEWKGSPAHLGPHRYTPLRQSLEYKTSNGLFSLMAAVVAFARQRLDPFTDTTVLGDLCEALMCYQVSPLYVAKPAREFAMVPKTKEMDLAEGAVSTFPWIFFANNSFRFGRWPTYPPVIQAAQTVSLARHVMPKRSKEFDNWAQALIERLSSIAYLPDPRNEPLPSGEDLSVYAKEARRVSGRPLSARALDLDFEFDEEENQKEFEACLGGSDWKNNRFLQSPEAMRDMGFVGTPYSLDDA